MSCTLMSATINSSVNGYSSVDSRHRSGRGMGRPQSADRRDGPRGDGDRCAPLGRDDGRPRRARAHRRRPLRDRHPRGALRRGAGRRPGRSRRGTTATASSSARATAPAPCTPRSRTAASSPATSCHVHGAALGAQRPPEPQQGPGRGDQHRPARPRLPRRRRLALAAKLRGLDYRTFVVLGDGELQEGSNWEAAMTAAHYDLDNLTAIVDRNRLQQGARTEDTKQLEPLADKWAAFGFEVRVDRRPRLHAAARRARAVQHRQAGRRHRQHDQGQGHLVHGGPRGVAPQGPVRRPGPDRAAGARPDDLPARPRRADLRLPQGLRRHADRARPRRRADRRRLQRLRRLLQPRRLPRGVPRPPDQRRHRRAGPRRRRRRPGQRRPDPVRLRGARRS